jgi:hypothetical protein
MKIDPVAMEDNLTTVEVDLVAKELDLAKT